MPKGPPTPHSRQACPCPDRQYSCLLHKSPGRDQVSPLSQGGPETTLLVTPRPDLTEGHSRGSEPGSGPPLQVRTSPRGVEDTLITGGQFMGTLWSGPDRLRFMSRETTHCPRWFSLNPPKGPLGLDALSHKWPEGLLYAFPPLPLIPYLLNSLRDATRSC